MLVHCFAGCDLESVLDAVGWTMRQLFDDWEEPQAEASRGTPYSPTKSPSSARGSWMGVLVHAEVESVISAQNRGIRRRFGALIGFRFR